MFYKCIRSGNTLEVTDPEDIEKMKTNESYVLIGDSSEKASQEEIPVQNADAPSQVKQRGRPAKVKHVVQQPVAAEQDRV